MVIAMSKNYEMRQENNLLTRSVVAWEESLYDLDGTFKALRETHNLAREIYQKQDLRFKETKKVLEADRKYALEQE